MSSRPAPSPTSASFRCSASSASPASSACMLTSFFHWLRRHRPRARLPRHRRPHGHRIVGAAAAERAGHAARRVPAPRKGQMSVGARGRRGHAGQRPRRPGQLHARRARSASRCSGATASSSSSRSARSTAPRRSSGATARSALRRPAAAGDPPPDLDPRGHVTRWRWGASWPSPRWVPVSGAAS